MVTRSDIVTEARTYLDVPWRHQGRSRENGVDCAGLAVVVVDHFSLIPDEVATHRRVDYPRRPDGTFVSYFRAHCKPKPLTEAQDGDLIVFAEGRHVCHVGFRTTFRGQPGVIHAHARARKVIEQTLESAYDTVGRPIYCFELPSIED